MFAMFVERKLHPTALWSQQVCSCTREMCVERADTLSRGARAVWMEAPGFSLHIWANSAQTKRAKSYSVKGSKGRFPLFLYPGINQMNSLHLGDTLMVALETCF